MIDDEPQGLRVTSPPSGEVLTGDDGTTLVDLLDRVIDRGVVVTGDVVLGVAGVDLVHVGLRLVLRGVDEPGGVR
jgi:hypothetical protein